MTFKRFSHWDDKDLIKDRFEVDPLFESKLAFPCCVCIHRHVTDEDEPCIRCENNLRSTGY